MLIFEIGFTWIKLKFYLMNFFWGKALYDFFLGCMIISAYVFPPIDIPAAIFLFAATIVLLLISVCFRKEEKERIDRELEVIEKIWKEREEKAKALRDGVSKVKV